MQLNILKCSHTQSFYIKAFGAPSFPMMYECVLDYPLKQQKASVRGSPLIQYQRDEGGVMDREEHMIYHRKWYVCIHET